MDAGVQRAIAAEGEAIAELRQADEDEREQGAAVPVVVEEDVEVVEGVLVQEVGLVEEEHGVDALFGALLDMTRDGVEQAACGGRGRELEGRAELAIEVAAAEGGVVTVGEAEAGGGDAVAQRAQDAGLADARLTDEDDAGVLVERVEELVDDGGLGRREPELGVGDLLGERWLLEAEDVEVGHERGSLR